MVAHPESFIAHQQKFHIGNIHPRDPHADRTVNTRLKTATKLVHRIEAQLCAKSGGSKKPLTMSAATSLAEPAFQLSNNDDNEDESLTSWPRVRISHMPELRLQMKELDMDGEEWRFLAYTEEDRGLVGGQ